MEKRVLFRSAWLPWVLLLPQLVVISVFFFWPAGQALVQSFQMQDAFGMSTEWVGLENFRNLFEDPSYLASFKTTGKRVFKMAPLQHHFELLGWQEVTIVIRFWIVAGLFVALGLGLFYAEWVVGAG